LYVIIETGGKQFKVKEGDTIQVEKLDAAAGSDIVFDRVLAICDGDDAVFGSPVVAGVLVKGTILGNGKHKKVIIYKFKSKKGFHKKKGHRQPFTTVKIESIKK
jgi:large subunit ribosomal protein L21